MKKFWMVWHENDRCPVVKHPSESLARREAERLARINHGQKFFVLAAIDCCRCNDIMWEVDNEIPF